ncbi:PAP2 superfamily protein [Rhizobium aethiopicum]|uniref:PAP2 superfamily protein n=1 Tax=Rhizobium aethiopicum TaxID=1138170 RepID=A0A1C3YA89_9HYPH|nr:phosphatase PAP2 family protein [Rhizobium aethiopicum]SCB61396.1 PAP2 superfamily protein [Rhizobium aethiopicum]
MRAFWISLDRRWRRTDATMPPLRWQACLFITINAVLLSMLLFDAPIGASVPPTSVKQLGEFLTGFGDSAWLICTSILLFFQGRAGYKLLNTARAKAQALYVSWIGAYLFTTVVCSGLLANLLKRAIGRARPDHFHDYGIFSFTPFSGRAAFESFPSGHSTTVGAFFAAFALLFPRYRVAFIACAIWFGMTRVMVGAHYPSDVIAGLAFGGWFSLLTAIVYARCGLLFKLAPDGWPLAKRLFRTA